MVNTETNRSVGMGDVEIILAGEELVLKPSYRAAKTLSAKYGGLTSAIERVVRLDLDLIVDVIAIGLGYTSTKRPPEDLGQKIFETGLTDDTGLIAERCITFLRVLAAGGRPLPSDDLDLGDDDDDADPPVG